MKRILQVLANPFLLPLLPAAVIMALLPIDYKPFVLEIQDRQSLAPNNSIYYDDITGDGYSERILTGEEDTYTWVKIYDHNGVLFDQWNFVGRQEYLSFIHTPAITKDYNGDGRKAVFVFTLAADSLFLHMIDDLENPRPRLRNRFIATVGPGHGQPDPRISVAYVADIIDDGYKELLFMVSSRFSRYPRRVFAYSIAADSLMASPESFYNVRWFKMADITGDGSMEFILSGTSASNVSPSEHHFHDHSNWLMVLDKKLEFLFDPVEVPGRAKRLFVFPLERDSEKLIGTVLFRANQNKPAVLSSYDTGGVLLEERELDMDLFRGFKHPVAGQNILVLNNQDRETFIYDIESDRVLREHPVPATLSRQSKDLTGNGEEEVITYDWSTNTLVVFRNDMQDYTKLRDEISFSNETVLSFINNPGQNPLISLQTGAAWYKIQYARNPHFYYSYAYFAGIYLVFFFFGMMTRFYQKNQLSKKQSIEKKITGLQLNLVKNQLSPHFSLNAINAAIQTIKKEETGKAADYLGRFARMHRAMVLSADSMHRSLAEEIQFVRDYVELEKLRFDHAFDVEIIVSDEVDQDVQLPKMILQNYAENAIKHGLAEKKGDGLLRISIDRYQEKIRIRISDNGVGREMAAGSETSSTGRGLEIMSEYYKLYKKYYGMHIDHQISDLYDASGKPAGTLVEIEVLMNVNK